MKTRIIQIMPAPLGWRAVYAVKGESPWNLMTIDVAGFALVEDLSDGARYVEALIPDDRPASGLMVQEEGCGNYIGLAPPGDPLDGPFVEEAERMIKSGRAL